MIAGPFIEGKEPDRIVLFEYCLRTFTPGVLHYSEVNHLTHAFRSSAEPRGVRRYPDVPEGYGVSRRNHADRSPDLRDALPAYDYCDIMKLLRGADI